MVVTGSNSTPPQGASSSNQFEYGTRYFHPVAELRNIEEKAPCFIAGMNPTTGNPTTSIITNDSIS